MHQRVARVTAETVAIVAYDPAWPAAFAAEAAHLRDCLPGDLLGRIEHVGSTAIPGLPAKPIVDLLIEVPSLAAARARLAPRLRGDTTYEYFWRPGLAAGDPWYCWFIKRTADGRRTHHLHFVEPGFPQWRWLAFRDWLRTHPEDAAAYADLKRQLATAHPADRIAYTQGKGEFIRRITAQAYDQPGAP